MIGPALLKIGLAVLSAALSAVPVERIVAALLSRWLAKLDAGKVAATSEAMARAAKTATHLAELAEQFGRIVEDRQITEAEADAIRKVILEDRKALLALWARGESAKLIEANIAAAKE